MYGTLYWFRFSRFLARLAQGYQIPPSLALTIWIGSIPPQRWTPTRLCGWESSFFRKAKEDGVD
jgi:hypothetical protein